MYDYLWIQRKPIFVYGINIMCVQAGASRKR